MKVGFISLSCLSTELSCRRYYNYLKCNEYYTPEIQDADYLVIVCCINKYENEEELYDIVKQYNTKKIVLVGCVMPEIIKDFQHMDCRIVREDLKFEKIFPPVRVEMKDVKFYDVINECANPRMPLYIRNKYDSYEKFIDIIKSVNEETAFKLSTSIIGYDFRNKQQNYFPILISEGCNFSCNYCIACKIKGKCTSRPIEDIIRDIQTGYNNGFRTFLLLADDMLSYGCDIYSKSKFSFLLERIQQTFENIKLMIRYLEPMNLPKLWSQIKQFITDEFVCYLNIPIQSASENVLDSINRDTDLNEIKSIIMQIREKYSGPLITHIIYGFPFETREDIIETADYLTLFDNVSIHEFSARKNTAFEKLSINPNAQEHFRILENAKKNIQARFLKNVMSTITKKVPEKVQKEREYRYPITYITKEFEKVLNSLEWIEDGEQSDIVFMNPQVKGFVARIRQNNNNVFLQFKIEKEKFEWHEISVSINCEVIDNIITVLKDFMVPMGVVSKKRKHAIYSPKVTIYLDDVVHLGPFFEVEGVDERVDELLRKFSIDINKAYPPYGKILDKLELDIDNEVIRALYRMRNVTGK